MKMNKATRVMLGVFTIELLVFFFLKREIGFILSPLVFVALSIFTYLYLEKREQYFALNGGYQPISRKKVLVYFGILTAVATWWAGYFIKTYPLDVKLSDIIPLIQDVYINRMLNGEAAYSLYTGFNYGTFTPNYLPFHWLPLTISTVLSFDPRWICFGIFMISVWSAVLKARKTSASLTEETAKGSLLFLFLFLLFLKQGKEFAVTVELMLTGYYILFYLSFTSKKALSQASALTLTLLSRYSIIVWMPVWTWVKFQSNRKQFFLISGIVFALIICTYIIPFVLPAPGSVSDNASLWLNASVNEWNGQDWQKPGDRPFQLFRGTGFASWFYYLAPGDIPAKIALLKYFMVGVPGIASLILLYRRYKQQKPLSDPIFLLISAKLCLTLFYAFVIIPFEYLYWVPLVITPVILLQMNWFKQEDEAVSYTNS